MSCVSGSVTVARLPDTCFGPHNYSCPCENVYMCILSYFLYRGVLDQAVEHLTWVPGSKPGVFNYEALKHTFILRLITQHQVRRS